MREAIANRDSTLSALPWTEEKGHTQLQRQPHQQLNHYPPTPPPQLRYQQHPPPPQYEQQQPNHDRQAQQQQHPSRPQYEQQQQTNYDQPPLWQAQPSPQYQQPLYQQEQPHQGQQQYRYQQHEQHLQLPPAAQAPAPSFSTLPIAGPAWPPPPPPMPQLAELGLPTHRPSACPTYAPPPPTHHPNTYSEYNRAPPSTPSAYGPPPPIHHPNTYSEYNGPPPPSLIRTPYPEQPDWAAATTPPTLSTPPARSSVGPTIPTNYHAPTHAYNGCYNGSAAVPATPGTSGIRLPSGIYHAPPLPYAATPGRIPKGRNRLEQAVAGQWRSVLGSDGEREAAQLEADSAYARDRLGRYSICLSIYLSIYIYQSI